eukprot:2209521-Lingulodinium_polyedra.AAC.1
MAVPCLPTVHIVRTILHRVLEPRLAWDLAGSICIYSDEVQPGNVLRPDKGRSFLAVYWGVTELPDFF